MFGKRTTADILADLKKTVERLKAHADNSNREATRHVLEANQHQMFARMHNDEAEAATRVAGKLSDLIS